MFFTYSEVNDLKVNNSPISDELNPKAGSSTELTNYALKHRKRRKAEDLSDEDYTAIFTAGAVGVVGVLAVIGLVPASQVKPAANNFQVSYVGNVVKIDFTLANITGGESYLKVYEKETQETLFLDRNLTVNKAYSFEIGLEYNIVYIGMIGNINGNNTTVIKSFELVTRK